MKTKLFSLLLAIVAGTTALMANRIQIGDLYYELNSIDHTATVTFESYSGGEYNSSWYITSAVIPESVTYKTKEYNVTSIGDYAFCGCSRLTSVTIPNSVTSIGEYAFYGCRHLPVIDNIRYADTYLVEAVDKTLSTYTIKDGTKWIGKDAFWGCSSLTSIEIPNCVTSIEGYAFNNCSRLTSVTIPESVTSIGDWAFSGCSNLPIIDNIRYADTYLVGVVDNALSTYIIKEETRFIGSGAFWGCSSLTSITIPNSVTNIGICAFYECNSLNSVVWNAKRCNDFNFTSNTPFYSIFEDFGERYTTDIRSQITSVTFGDEVEYIPAYLCWGLTNLTSVTIPESVTSVGYGAFSGCSNLPIIDNIRYADTYLVEVVDRTLSTYTIEKGTRFIGDHAFKGCEMTSVIIPNSVTSIGNYAFSDCSGLTSITIGKSVTSIGVWAFSDCSSLTSVVWNAKKCNAGYYSDWGSSYSISTPFYYLNDYSSTFDIRSQITSFTFGDEVEYIPAYLCYGLTSLTSIDIPNNVTSIGEDAFSGCNSLTEIVWNAIDCNSAPFYNIRSQITSFTFGDEVKNIPDNLCKEMNNLTSITIPNSVITIGTYTFYNCAGIRNLQMSNKVESIGAHCFEDCRRINYISLPATLTHIGTDAFKNTPFLTSAGEWDNGILYINSVIIQTNPIELPENPTIKEGTTAIYQGAFKNCRKMKSISIPESITELPDSTFYNCTSLHTIDIPNGLTSIGQYAFNGCSSLTSIEIPNSVTIIGKNAFKGCSSLTSVTIPNSVTSIGKEAFSNCWSLTSVTIGNSVTRIGYGAFGGCSSLTSISIPKDVTYIGDYTFYDCNRLNDVTWNVRTYVDFSSSKSPFYNNLSNSLDKFDLRSQIKSFSLGNDVEYIPAYLCSRMKSLTSIVIPNSVTSIGEYAFSGCSSLTSIDIPNNVTNIGEYAFSGCERLNQITIGHALENIGNNAFDNCPNVLTIYSYLETPPAINKTVFAGFGTYKGVDLYIPTGSKANYETMDIWKEFYIIEGLPDIVDNGLHYKLNEETLTATLITSSLLELKTKIKGELVVPATVYSNGKEFTVTAVGNSVFKDNNSITTVVLPATVVQVGDSAFYGSKITSVVIGGVETPVPSYLPARKADDEPVCYEIGKYAFANCEDMTEVTFPACVSSIGTGAFKGCSSMKKIYSQMTTPPAIEATVFEGCGVLANITLYVPEGSEPTYTGKDVWKDFFVKKDVKEYTVTFLDKDGNVIETQYVDEGNSATSPDAPQVDGWKFVGWNIAFDNVQSDITVIAQYEEILYHTLIVISTDELTGTVTGSGEYEEGETITIEAVPATGYKFVQWSDGNTDNPRTVTLTENMTLTAIFESQNPTSVESVNEYDGTASPRKVMRNGLMYILMPDGRMYDPQGTEL